MCRGMVALIFVLASVFVVSCSDDGSGPKYDRAIAPADKGAVVPDKGGPPGDAGDAGATDGGADTDFTTGTLTCQEVVNCTATCAGQTDYESCWKDCVSQGTAAAQTLFYAWYNCLMDAVDNACKDDCVDKGSNKCMQCASGECMTELAACTGA